MACSRDGRSSPVLDSRTTHEHTIKLATEMFPDADCRKLTGQDFAKLRNTLKATRASRSGATSRLHAMYSAAAKEAIDNPFHDIPNPVGVSIESKAEPSNGGADKVLTPPEVRTILETAAQKAARVGLRTASARSHATLARSLMVIVVSPSTAYRTRSRRPCASKVPKYWTDRIMGHSRDISDSYGGGPEELPETAECVLRVKY
jgi:hypothetical protein